MRTETTAPVVTPLDGDQFWQLSRSNFRRIAAMVESELGIKMPDSKIRMVQGRLAQRARDLRIESLDAYCEYFFNLPPDSIERTQLLNAVTTNKTDFFREPQHFEYLSNHVLPELESTRNSTVLGWSAACSSGEEPYTLAMVMSEFAQTHPGFAFRILATDISTKVLDLARRGVYTAEQTAPIPVALRNKYLLKGRGANANLRRIVPALRSVVSFHSLNFMNEEYQVRQMFDFIFCRNVLIYFDRPTQEAVINRLCRRLKPGGYIFIGHSESVVGFDAPLEAVGPSCSRKVGDR